jgi:putative membrane protein
MKTSLFTATAAGALLALAACSPSGTGQETGETAEAGESTEAAATDTTAATAESAAATDPQGFATQMAASDMFEIESGKLAQQNGKSQEVKDFGAMLVKDHTKSSADLKAAAGQSEGVTVAPKLTAKQQSDLDALKNAKDDFDATFKQQQVAAHTMALSLLQGQAKGGTGALKEFAAKTAPVVEAHLAEARELP